ITIDQALELAIENNASLKASNLKIDEANALVGSAFSFDKTSVYYHYDENNLAINNEPLKVFGISQDFRFPTVYFAQKKANNAKASLERSNFDIQFQQIKEAVLSRYYQLSYEKSKARSYKYLDSLYDDFSKKAERRFELGETNYLEMLTAKSKQKQLETLYMQAQQDVLYAKEKLKEVIQIDAFNIIEQDLIKLDLETVSLESNLGLQHYESSKLYFKALHQIEKQDLLPDINLNYFQGSNGTLNDNLIGYQLGLKIPVLFSGNASKIKASKIAQDIIDEEQLDYKLKLNAKYQSLLATLQKYNEAIIYYETQGKKLSKEILKTANRTFKEGEIDFFKYIQSIETAKDIELSYLENLNAYNQTIIKINHLIL
ncbi:MAG: TolC family protein, partial [Flavobacteriaceae bacterium]